MFVHRDQTPIYYEVHGEGRPLLLIHAISSGHAMWQPQLEIADQARLITFDARGVGHSGDLRGWGALRDQFADDVAAILDQIGEPSALVCGVSFGGIVAQQFAARYPERVEGLVLVDTYSDSRPRSVKKAAWLANVYAGSVSNFLPRRVLRAILTATYARWPKAQAYYRESIWELRPLQAFKTRNAINLVNFIPALARHDFPIVSVVGSRCWWMAREFADDLARAVPRTVRHTIPDATDPSTLCQPEAFNDILREAIAWPR